MDDHLHLFSTVKERIQCWFLRSSKSTQTQKNHPFFITYRRSICIDCIVLSEGSAVNSEAAGADHSEDRGWTGLRVHCTVQNPLQRSAALQCTAVQELKLRLIS